MLLVIPILLLDLTNSENLSGFLTRWLMPYAIGWLLVILSSFGVAKAVRSTDSSSAPGDAEVRPEN